MILNIWLWKLSEDTITKLYKIITEKNKEITQIKQLNKSNMKDIKELKQMNQSLLNSKS